MPDMISRGNTLTFYSCSCSRADLLLEALALSFSCSQGLASLLQVSLCCLKIPVGCLQLPLACCQPAGVHMFLLSCLSHQTIQAVHGSPE